MIKCNTGVRKTNWVGDFPGYPEPVWYDPGGIVNIISMGRAEEYFDIDYSSKNNNGFVVTHKENGSVRSFHKSRKNLYYLDLKQKRELALVTTVADNKMKYTNRDVSKATLARKLQDVTGVLGRDLVIAVQSHIMNCPVTAPHAKMAEDIFGPSIAGVQGKTV